MKLKHAFNDIVRDSFKRVISELVLLVLLFNVNTYLGIFLLMILLFEIIISKDISILFYIFVFLSFNDEILKLDILHGSISRIVLILIIIKLFIEIVRKRGKIRTSHVLTFMFFAISTIIAILNKESLISGLISFLNITVVIMFAVSLRVKDKHNVDIFIEKLCYTILISVLCSVAYGLLTVNFLRYIQDGQELYRFNGSYEPNFMAMYVNMAILSLITLREKSNKIIYYILIAFLNNIIILTASMTGLASLLLCVMLYFILFIKDWRVLIKDGLFVVLLTMIFFAGTKMIEINNNHYYFRGHSSENIGQIENSTNSNTDVAKNNYVVVDKTKDITDEQDDDNSSVLIYRFKRISRLFEDGKIDEITSGRTAIARVFIHDSFARPLVKILFGNGIVDQKRYVSFFDKECLSHNSYIDFLYNFGAIGFVIIFIYMIRVTVKNKFFDFNLVGSKYCKNVKLIRIMLMIFALSLSFYTKRMFLIFFLL